MNCICPWIGTKHGKYCHLRQRRNGWTAGGLIQANWNGFEEINKTSETKITGDSGLRVDKQVSQKSCIYWAITASWFRFMLMVSVLWLLMAWWQICSMGFPCEGDIFLRSDVDMWFVTLIACMIWPLPAMHFMVFATRSTSEKQKLLAICEDSPHKGPAMQKELNAGMETISCKLTFLWWPKYPSLWPTIYSLLVQPGFSSPHMSPY